MLLLQNNSWEVRTTKTKGKGLFSTKEILPGTVIGDYLGMVVHPAEVIDDPNSFYLMYYHDTAGIFPDLSKPGIHLLNHSCSPNVWMYPFKGHTLFFTLRKIFPGEELTVSYLLSPRSSYDDPCLHVCTCGSSVCTRSMHLTKERFEKWNEFHNNQMKETKRERIKYGHPLKRLAKYPRSIPDNPIYTLLGSEQQDPTSVEVTSILSIKMVRKIIRDSGRMIFIPKSKTLLKGVLEESVISEELV